MLSDIRSFLSLVRSVLHLKKSDQLEMIIVTGLMMQKVESVNTRQYIRHPTDIPIEFCLVDIPSQCDTNYINNVSRGGLSFRTNQFIEPKSWVSLNIPVYQESVDVRAQVCWCSKRDDGGYDVGVNFADKSSAFSARMVEQVCHIEQYRHDVMLNEGRELSGDEAAAEWIQKFANEFAQGF